LSRGLYGLVPIMTDRLAALQTPAGRCTPLYLHWFRASTSVTYSYLVPTTNRQLRNALGRIWILTPSSRRSQISRFAVMRTHAANLCRIQLTTSLRYNCVDCAKCWWNVCVRVPTSICLHTAADILHSATDCRSTMTFQISSRQTDC